MKHNAQIRKAAILIASLDERTAEALLKQMGPVQAARVRETLVELGEIDPREQNDVVEEFRRMGPLLPEKSPPGLELDAGLARKLAQSQTTQASEKMSAPLNSDTTPFRFLQEADTQTIAPLLQREHPQTIAMVISHLPPTRAAEVLSRFPSATQAEILRRLGDLDETDPEIVREVERGLEKWISEQSRGHKRRAAGLETIAAILDAADETTRHEILANLAGHDRSLARRLGGALALAETKHPRTLPIRAETQQPTATHLADESTVELPRWTFDDFVRQSDAAVIDTVRAAGAELAALALVDATPKLVDRITARMSKWEAKTLRKALSHLGPTRLSDVERAQQELADLAARASHKRKAATPQPRLAAVA